MTITIDAPPAATAVALARRATRLCLASSAAFVGLVATMIIGLADRQSAQDELAAELGVELNDIPPEQLADVIRQTWSWPAYVVIAALAVLSVALLSRGISVLGQIAGERRRLLGQVATALPFVGVVAFLGLLAAERALTEEPTWLVDNWWVWSALLAVFVLSVTGALVLAVVRNLSTGLARRASVVVLVLAVLVAVMSVTGGAPPILPILLSAAFAYTVQRAAAKQI